MPYASEQPLTLVLSLSPHLPPASQALPSREEVTALATLAHRASVGAVYFSRGRNTASGLALHNLESQQLETRV